MGPSPALAAALMPFFARSTAVPATFFATFLSLPRNSSNPGSSSYAGWYCSTTAVISSLVRR
jgi:hypothetical protein